MKVLDIDVQNILFIVCEIFYVVDV